MLNEHPVKKWFTAFFMAWGMFCAIPCPYPHWDAGARPQMLVCFPLLGLLLGAIWALAAFLLGLAGGLGLFGAAVLAALPYLLTGFIHLDGYMDCCDAILSRRDAAEKRRILKDSHVGSFAVICFGLALLCGFSLFATGDFSGKRALALLALPCAARCPSALAVMSLRPMETSSYAGAFSEGVKPGHRAAVLVILCLSAALPVLLGPWGLCGLAAALGGALAIWWGVRQLGGMNGDVSGLGVTVGELCGLAALALL